MSSIKYIYIYITFMEIEIAHEDNKFIVLIHPHFGHPHSYTSIFVEYNARTRYIHSCCILHIKDNFYLSPSHRVCTTHTYMHNYYCRYIMHSACIILFIYLRLSRVCVCVALQSVCIGCVVLHGLDILMQP